MPTLSVPLNQSDNERAFLERQETHSPASLPVDNPTRSFWTHSEPDANPLASEGSEGNLTEDVDICIIGSGITGVGAAYHLSQALEGNDLFKDKPIKAVILEARDFCSGATGRNGGHLTSNPCKEFYEMQKVYGTEEAIKSIEIESYTVSSLLNFIESHKLGDSVDLATFGRNELFLTEKEVSEAKADFESAKAAGIDLSDFELLDKENMNKRFGAAYPGLRCQGHNVWPLKLVTHLYKAAKTTPSNFSLAIHTRTPVTSISKVQSSESSPRRYDVVTPRGSIRCSYVIHATNAYASYLLPQFAGPEGIVPTRAQVISLKAAVGRKELGMSAWAANEGFEYWFPRPAKCIDGVEENPLVILGGGREAAAPKFELYETDDSVINEDVSRVLKDFLPGLLPGRYEKGREADMEWTGIFGTTKMGDPFVGPVLDPNGGKDLYEGQFIAAGYAGHGMPRAFACGEVVADMILSDIGGHEWSAPEWLPERYLTWNRVRK